MPTAVAAEFAGLGQAFNEMAELLQQQRSELQALNEALEVRVADRTRALLDSNNRLQVEIAERELTESSLRQVQKLQAVGQLAGGMAHEFNNLLTAILGSLELLRKRLGTPDSRQEKLLDVAARAVERGSRLTAQLLAFSRKQPLLAVSVSVAEAIQGMVGLLQSTLGASVRLETRVNDDLWPAMLDPNQFAASILNLALNARDAMPAGGRLRITASNMVITPASPWSELSVGDYICITVSDSGTGMSPSVVNRAFEPFFTTKEPGKGSGLGLSQVHGMVRQSAGSITIESRVGNGTEVRILVPRSLQAPLLPADGADLTQPAIERTRSVLLVDDDEQVRTVTEVMLAESGYAVVTAPEGTSAIGILEQADCRIALVIADYAMPGMTGRDLLRQVKQRWPDIAVLLATGYADYPDLATRELPIDHIVRKPFRDVELLARIHMVMQRQAESALLENRAPGE
jgi:signal transduction histidine kinase